MTYSEESAQEALLLLVPTFVAVWAFEVQLSITAVCRKQTRP